MPIKKSSKIRSESESGGLLKAKKRQAQEKNESKGKRVRFSEKNQVKVFKKVDKIGLNSSSIETNDDSDTILNNQSVTQVKIKLEEKPKIEPITELVSQVNDPVKKMAVKSMKKNEAKPFDPASKLKLKPKPDNKTKEKSFLTSKEKRELKKKRQMKENKYFEISEIAKKMWEEMRRGDCPKNKRFTLIDELLKKIDGKVKEIIRAHDTVRVVQCVLAYGTPEQRSKLFQSLKDDIVELTKTKYAKYFVIKMLDYGTQAEKNFIIRSFHGKVKQLLKNSYASHVIEHAYNQVANAKQRGLLVQEYYGTEFALFKDENKLTLGDVLKSLNSEQKKKILSQLKEELINLIGKGSIKHSITHHLLRDYFTFADLPLKEEMIAQLRELVVEILHTKDGARVACQCLWFGNAKDRKFIVKSFRKFVPKIAMEEQGHFVLLAAFDAVDDTKLIEKIILQELFSAENSPTLIKNKHAIKVFKYLVSPRDSRFFHKDCIAKLTPGDTNPHSKKEQSVRWSELKQSASPHLLDMVKNFADELLTDGESSLLLYTIISNVTDGDRSGAIDAIINVFAKAGMYKKETDPEAMHIIEKGNASYVLKKLLTMKNDADSNSFAYSFASKLDTSLLKSYIKCNRGCFILLSLIENVQDENVVKNLRSAINETKKELKKLDFAGSKLLLEKIA